MITVNQVDGRRAITRCFFDCILGKVAGRDQQALIRAANHSTTEITHLASGDSATIQSVTAVANLGIIRGLDYYTGTVLEARFKDSKEHWPKGTPSLSIGGGGRYDDLAGSFINQKLPGVGLSIGLTRLFGLLLDQGKITAGSKSPADVLVVLPDEARRAEASDTARLLRSRGYKVEMYHRDAKIKNQMAYAEKKGIKYVWFPPFKDGQPHEIKNMTSGEQSPADAASWTPAV